MYWLVGLLWSNATVGTIRRQSKKVAGVDESLLRRIITADPSTLSGSDSQTLESVWKTI